MRASSGQVDDRDHPWTSTVRHSIGLIDDGLVLGAGSVLVRMTKVSGMPALALEKDRERLLAMLAVAFGKLVDETPLLAHIRAASAHWQSGDKALANLRLAFAKLPRLRDPADVYRLCLAEHLLDAGVAPAGLMWELWPDAGQDELEKYNPDEPRVPTGSGVESGRWTFGPSGGVATHVQRPDTIIVAEDEGPPESEKDKEERERLGGSTIEDEARHGGINPTGGLLAGAGPALNTASQLSAAAQRAAAAIGPGKGPVYGTAVHMEFKAQVEALGRSDLHTETSYLNGRPVRYGKPGSVRADVVEGTREEPTGVHDLKTGGASLSDKRTQQLRDHLPDGQNIKIIEVRP